MLRTPSAIEGQGGAISEKDAREKGRMLELRDQMAQLAFENGLKVSESVTNSLMPTPTVADTFTDNLKSTQQKPGSMHSVTLAQAVIRPDLMPTPCARDFKDGTADRIRDGKVQTDSVAKTVINSGEVNGVNFGKFQAAIDRWARVIGRPAPAPTLPDGKDGNHRLSPLFTEWLMGLPEGWITDPSLGISRADQLKLAGNGVCPQQAELALTILLDGVEF